MQTSKLTRAESQFKKLVESEEIGKTEEIQRKVSQSLSSLRSEESNVKRMRLIDKSCEVNKRVAAEQAAQAEHLNMLEQRFSIAGMKQENAANFAEALV